MTLEIAVQKIIDTLGMASQNTARIVTILAQCSSPANISQHTLDKVLRAGRALRAIGVK